LERRRVEREYRRLIDDYGYGNTIWSPLASGLLTGKYRDGIPEGSRGALAGYEWLRDRLSDSEALARVERLRPIADRLGCSMAQLAIAWCLFNRDVSSVITGATRVEQVQENFAALEVLDALTPEIDQEIRAAIS
jgi:aryl-alcohol dehydrogenase-like predicted oxidoreductase